MPIPVDNRVNELCQLIVSEHDPAKVNELLQQLNAVLKDAALHAQNKLVSLSRSSPS
jgi:hypothetical protein